MSPRGSLNNFLQLQILSLAVKMGAPNPVQFHYIELMCESLLHGMYTVLVIVIIWLLLNKPQMPRIHKVMFVAGIVMWLLSSAHLALFVHDGSHNGMASVAVAHTLPTIATLQFMIGDMIIIWRIWAVWGGSYLAAALPFALMLASAGARFDTASKISNLAIRPRSAIVATGLLITNVLLSTFLIAGRIWYMQWQMHKLLGHAPSKKSRSMYTGVLMLTIESGGIYALSQIVNLILDDLHNEGIHTVLDLQVPLAGILPTLIILVVHLKLAQGTDTIESYHAAVTSNFQAAPLPIVSSAFGGQSSHGTTLSLTVETVNEFERNERKQDPYGAGINGSVD
ncbi:hypothetical protein GALMADRAFT_144778 [Galerina marginata CBS 339.88]|uniref:Uncharacterized protein n=1 Tax=Galerina marginata (strain CBS 339.88) TaxID=685588 RepID=A0A067SHV1_GALM3|nr:hypothetical protein GALMADRAFT_144778 [Galerina marginata CBS 339.88]